MGSGVSEEIEYITRAGHSSSSFRVISYFAECSGESYLYSSSYNFLSVRTMVRTRFGKETGSGSTVARGRGRGRNRGRGRRGGQTSSSLPPGEPVSEIPTQPEASEEVQAVVTDSVTPPSPRDHIADAEELVQKTLDETQNDIPEDDIPGDQATDHAEKEDDGKEQEVGEADPRNVQEDTMIHSEGALESEQQRIEKGTSPLYHEEPAVTHEGATAELSLSLSDESLNTIIDRTVDKLFSERMERENAVVMPAPFEPETKSDDSDNAPLATLRKRHSGKQKKKRKISDDFSGPSKKRKKEVIAKMKLKQKKSKSRKRKATLPPVSAEQAMDVTHFDDGAELFEYDILANRKFVPEARFTDPLHKDVGFLAFLRMKGLRRWAVSLKSYCPKLVREFYANLTRDVLEEESPWFHRAYVQGKMIELSPQVINNLLHLPSDNPEVFPSALIKESRREVALRLSAWKSDDFGRSGLAATELTMKYQCLFRFCAMNVFPTSNGTNIGYEMGKLLLCIDKFCADINFGFVVISRMMKYARGKSFDKTNLPYPSLITLLLKQNGILPDPTEDSIQTTFFKPRSNLQKLFNDFKEPLPADPSGQLLEARRLLLEVL
ncbi:uncharacterized protein LOC127263629 [Andrographis paniculata]|uniref:uncharacterized protein LOC127263629 n=1 Tax=Andrographis paniculata TaxID=175694 RepID=UPI0021E81741|nr:uncharacterized protein LOC127263629 [Andrographis paniculata]